MMTNIDNLYIPKVSDAFPSPWPPQDPEEAEAWSDWLKSLDAHEKFRYDSHLAAAITDVVEYGAESEKPITVPPGCYTECISTQFPWSLGGPTRKERIDSHFMIYQMTADERERYDFERRRIIRNWERKNPQTEAESGKTQTQTTRIEGESEDPQQAEGSRKAASRGGKEDQSDPESEETIRGHWTVVSVVLPAGSRQWTLYRIPITPTLFLAYYRHVDISFRLWLFSSGSS